MVWYMDSSATHHITPHKSVFHIYTEFIQYEQSWSHAAPGLIKNYYIVAYIEIYVLFFLLKNLKVPQHCYC